MPRLDGSMRPGAWSAGRRRVERTPLTELAAPEVEVLRLVAHRLPNSEIAAALVVGETTACTPKQLLALAGQSYEARNWVVLGVTAAQQ